MRTLLAILILSCAACGTVTPKAVESSVASFDGNEQNSGFLGFFPEGARITAHARDRFNLLVSIYGRDANLSKDQGLSRNSDGTYTITREVLVKFLQMNDWHRAGLKPVTP